MLGRCQNALYRGVLSALQHQQQQCLQLEVLGLQGIRSINDWRLSKPIKRARDAQRRAAVLQKALDGVKQEPAGATSPSIAGAAATSAAETITSSSSSSSSSSSGPVASPLSAQLPVGQTSSSSSVVDVSTTPAAAAAGNEDAAKSWAPAWLNRLMDFPGRRRSGSGPQGTASPLQKAAPEADSEAKKGEDGWESLDKMKNMTLDEYQTSLKQEGSDSADSNLAPRPKKPANLGPRGLYSERLDLSRVSHARFGHHVTLIGMMTHDEKLRVHADPSAALKDEEFIGRIAAIANTKTEAVRDMIRSYRRRREFAEVLAEHRAAGKEMPLSTDDLAAGALALELKAKRANAKLKGVLAARDPANCQLKPWASVIGPNRTCPRTKLPYKECCGAMKIKGKKKALRR